MVRSLSVRTVANLGIASALALFLGACGSFSLPSLSSSSPEPAPEPGVGPEMPATIRADEIVGRWGLASYQNPADRARTEAAAKGQCKQPYVIGAGTSGGVVMHLADQATPQELRLKGSPGGKNYIGPPGPAGGCAEVCVMVMPPLLRSRARRRRNSARRPAGTGPPSAQLLARRSHTGC